MKAASRKSRRRGRRVPPRRRRRLPLKLHDDEDAEPCSRAKTTRSSSAPRPESRARYDAAVANAQSPVGLFVCSRKGDVHSSGSGAHRSSSSAHSHVCAENGGGGAETTGVMERRRLWNEAWTGGWKDPCDDRRLRQAVGLQGCCTGWMTTCKRLDRLRCQLTRGSGD